MTKGKPWTAEKEAELKQLVASDQKLESIASQMGKTPNAIYQKCLKLGLMVKEEAKRYTSSSIPLPNELPSPEEALKMLAGALEAATQPGLDKVEVQRLQVVATLARVYDHLLAKYLRYREIEEKLVDLERKYAQLTEKTKSDASKPDAAQMVQPST